MAQIIMSALGPSLTEQCDALGMSATGTDLAMGERLADAVNLCYVRGVLTEAEANKARKRILVSLRLRQVRAATQAPSAAKKEGQP